MQSTPKHTAKKARLGTTMTKDYRNKWWTIAEKGIVEIWGAMTGRPECEAESLTAAVSVTAHPDDDTLLVKFADGTEWMLEYSSRGSTPADDWRGTAVRDGQIARKKRLQLGHVPHDTHRRVMFVGVQANDKAVARRERILDADVIQVMASPCWSQASGERDDVYTNKGIIRDTAKDYDAIDGETPVVAPESLREASRGRPESDSAHTESSTNPTASAAGQGCGSHELLHLNGLCVRMLATQADEPCAGIQSLYNGRRY